MVPAAAGDPLTPVERALPYRRMALDLAVLASVWFRGLRLESHQQRADQRFLGGDIFGAPESVSTGGSAS